MQAGVVADMCNIRRAAQRPTILATARHACRARQRYYRVRLISPVLKPRCATHTHSSPVRHDFHFNPLHALSLIHI